MGENEMAEKPTRTFVVTGKGPFPIDMLRHDQCYPAAPADVDSIEFSLRPKDRPVKRKIMLSTHAHPNVDRWNSFGWSVIDGEVF
jgi:hypothetical protein